MSCRRMGLPSFALPAIISCTLKSSAPAADVLPRPPCRCRAPPSRLNLRCFASGEELRCPSGFQPGPPALRRSGRRPALQPLGDSRSLSRRKTRCRACVPSRSVVLSSMSGVHRRSCLSTSPAIMPGRASSPPPRAFGAQPRGHGLVEWQPRMVRRVAGIRRSRAMHKNTGTRYRCSPIRIRAGIADWPEQLAVDAGLFLGLARAPAARACSPGSDLTLLKIHSRAPFFLR